MNLTVRLRDALASAAAPGLLAGDSVLPPEGAPSVPAAVLVAITDRPEPGIILTQRTETVSRHAGQIAFPGGRVDPGDADAIAAALREAEEEISLPASAVQVIGIADTYRTVTGYEVVPVVALVPPDLDLVAQPSEVAAIFEAPLAFLLDRENQMQRSAMWQGRERDYYEIAWEGRRIWGATAAMLVNLSRRLEAYP